MSTTGRGAAAVLKLVGLAEDAGPDGPVRTAIISGSGELFLVEGRRRRDRSLPRREDLGRRCRADRRQRRHARCAWP